MPPPILDLHHPARTRLLDWRPSRSVPFWIVAATMGPLLILAVLWISRPFQGTGCTKEGSAKADLSFMGTALDAFQVDNGRYPTATEGLDALITRPPSLPSWHGPYVEPILTDPWTTPYRYPPPTATATDLRSAGPDKTFNTPDDLTN